MPVIKSSFFDRIVLWYVWRIAPLPFRTEGCGNLTQEEYVYEKETVDFDFNGCPWHVGGSGRLRPKRNRDGDNLNRFPEGAYLYGACESDGPDKERGSQTEL